MRARPTGTARLTRRQLLYGGGAAAVVAITGAGCDALGTDPAGSDGAGGSQGKGPEAPSLAEQVESGDLPAVEERLPTNPLEIPPADRIGVYGGTWRTALLGRSDTAWLDRTIGYDYLVRWDPEWSEVIPNIAERFEGDEEGRSYTFYLREGMKWSDGEPFTADDIVFAYEGIAKSEDIRPSGPSQMFYSPEGELVELEKIDDYTVRFTFSQPNGMFLQEVATPDGKWLTWYPAHYLRDFLPEHNPDIEQIASDAGFSTWVDYFEDRSTPWTNSEMPTLFAWQMTSALGDSTRVVAERNPYYWKVDPDGSQLPYLDSVAFQVVEDPEVMLLNATNGEMDLHMRHINELENKPVLAQSREESGYRFIDMVPGNMNQMIIMLNLTHDDPVLREVFQNKDFRIGLSHAIDRDEMIAAVFQQQGVPWQGAPRAESDFYDEEFATQYLEFDVDEANSRLDAAGLTERDGDGFRLRPDGEGRLKINVEVPVPTLWAHWVPALELVQGYWAEVGVDMEIKSEDRSLWTERVNANQHDAAVWQGDGGLFDAIQYAFYYLPYHGGSRYAMLWKDWYTSGGEDGEEPPEPARRQLELYDEILTTFDEDERDRLFREILEISKEQFYVIGTVQLEDEYGIIKEGFHNVPENMPSGYLYPTPAPTRPEQYFIES